MILSSQAFQFESDSGFVIKLELNEYFVEEDFVDESSFAKMRDLDGWSTRSDGEELDDYKCWKEQSKNCVGAGTPAPSIPRSQRQYDGDNFYD
jgi:hypothetical protein